MTKQHKKLIVLIALLLAIPYPIWYGINCYAAGLVNQTQLIEFSMEEDFIYCNDWCPELLDKDIRIDKGVFIHINTPSGYQIAIPIPDYEPFVLSPKLFICEFSLYTWAKTYGGDTILKRLNELNIKEEFITYIPYYLYEQHVQRSYLSNKIK